MMLLFIGDTMEVYVDMVLLGILYLVCIFLVICGLMSAIIISNHLGLVGRDWWFVFLSLLGVFWGGSLARINVHKE